MITFSAVNEIAGVRHAFFTREGGVSGGPYQTLNCGYGSGDDPDKVTRNRDIAMELMGLQGVPVITAYQEHTPNVAVVDAPWSREDAPVADGMVTNIPEIGLGILTADCAPILIADKNAKVIGAGHAGWRGALAGIAGAVVEAMRELGGDPKQMVAAVGPCIAQRSYEVGAELYDAFCADDDENRIFFAAAQRDGHFMFDLSSYVMRSLAKAGVKNVVRGQSDTCREEDRFFSYRRTVKNGGGDYGRGLSVIALTGRG